MKILLYLLIALTLTVTEEKIQADPGTSDERIGGGGGGSGGISTKVDENLPSDLHPLIIRNPGIHSHILEEIIRTKDRYHPTSVCIECLKKVIEDIVKRNFYQDINGNTESQIKKGTFLNLICEYLNDEYSIDNNKLRMLTEEENQIRQKIAARYFNFYNNQVDNCTQGKEKLYTERAIDIKNEFQSKSTFDCAQNVIQKQNQEDYNGWIKALDTLYKEENQKCFKAMELSSDTIQKIHLELIENSD